MLICVACSFYVCMAINIFILISVMSSCHNFLISIAFTTMPELILGFTPSQWETSLQGDAVSHWLGANLESACMHFLSLPSTWAAQSQPRCPVQSDVHLVLLPWWLDGRLGYDGCHSTYESASAPPDDHKCCPSSLAHSESQAGFVVHGESSKLLHLYIPIWLKISKIWNCLLSLNIQTYMNGIYKHVFRVCTIWDAQSF